MLLRKFYKSRLESYKYLNITNRGSISYLIAVAFIRGLLSMCIWLKLFKFSTYAI